MHISGILTQNPARQSDSLRGMLASLSKTSEECLAKYHQFEQQSHPVLHAYLW